MNAIIGLKILILKGIGIANPDERQITNPDERQIANPDERQIANPDERQGEDRLHLGNKRKNLRFFLCIPLGLHYLCNRFAPFSPLLAGARCVLACLMASGVSYYPNR